MVKVQDLMGFTFVGTRAQAETLYRVTAPQLEEAEQYVLRRYLAISMPDELEQRYERMDDKTFRQTWSSVVAKLPAKIEDSPAAQSPA